MSIHAPQWLKNGRSKHRCTLPFPTKESCSINHNRLARQLWDANHTGWPPNHPPFIMGPGFTSDWETALQSQKTVPPSDNICPPKKARCGNLMTNIWRMTASTDLKPQCVVGSEVLAAECLKPSKVVATLRNQTFSTDRQTRWTIFPPKKKCRPEETTRSWLFNLVTSPPTVSCLSSLQFR